MRKFGKRINRIGFLCGLLFLLSACGLAESPVLPEVNSGESGKYETGTFDSADTPVVVLVDTQEQKITLYNSQVGKNYTLSYDGTSTFYDKYGTTLTAGQLTPGQMVDVQFMKKSKHLANLQVSSTAWYFGSTDQYQFDSVKRTLTIGGDVYGLSENTAYFSGGKMTTEQQILDGDVLTFYGIDKTIYSVTVERGHGYLRLTGIEYFVDGWVEIGTRIVERVGEEMLLPVPEGNFSVKISNNGTVAEKQVLIVQNQEAVLDFGDVEVKNAKAGTVIFSLEPSDAKLFVDGTETDTSTGVELSYGMHQLLCKAEGYESVTRYLSVGAASAGISITLEKSDATTESETTTAAGETSTAGTTTTTGETNTAGTTTTTGTTTATGTTTTTGTTGTATGTAVGAATATTAGTTGTVSGNTTATVSGNTLGTTSAGTATTSTTSAGTATTTSYYKVYIDSPENVEVYVDGAYVGVAPCTFKKITGSHLVTLQKEGYVSRSYTIQVDNDEKDISYSFVDLVPSE